MGTSTSQPSPSLPPWRPAKAYLGRPDVTPEQQCAELWKAAFGERGKELTAELSSPVLARAWKLAGEVESPAAAVRSFDEIAAASYEASLALDMGRRALARVTATDKGSAGFAEELFAEATSYYASRDLSSYVGASGRVSSSSASIELKGQLRDVARTAVRDSAAESTDWGVLVRQVLSSLRNSGNVR